MKAIIFNSGLGSRMAGLTENNPKCMVKLYNQETIFERQIRILSACGIKDFIITTGPFKEQLYEVANKFENLNFQFVANDDYKNTNYIVSMNNAYDYLDDETTYLYGDTYYMDEAMDTGDILLTEETKIDENETTGELWNRLSKIGADLLVNTLKQIEEGSIERKKQGEDFTMAPMLNKEMSKIDWENKTAKEIKNLVRGLNPIMGTYSTLEDKKYKFWKVDCITEEELFIQFPELLDYKDRYYELFPGTILFADEKIGLYIKTIDAVIKVLEIQGENARKMEISEFLRGNKLYAASVFE